MQNHLQACELRALARKAARTGKIPEELVRYYDHNGKWVGDRMSWPTTTLRSLAQIMRGIVLPPRRRSSNEHGRKILLTSVCWCRQDILVADWHEIRGYVYIGAHAGISNPYLDTICGSLIGASADRVHLPQLRTVGGEYGFKRMARLVETPMLRRVGDNMRVRGWQPRELESVGGSLLIVDVLDVSLPKLLQVGGNISAPDCRDFAAQALEYIGGDLDMVHSARCVTTPNLRKVGGSFTVPLAVRIDAPRLREVGQYAFTCASPTFAPWVMSVGKEWVMHDQTRATLALYQRARDLLRGGEDFFV